MIDNTRMDKTTWVSLGMVLFATIFAIMTHALISVIFELACFILVVLYGLIGQIINTVEYSDVFDNAACDNVINVGALNIVIVVCTCIIARLANLI